MSIQANIRRIACDSAADYLRAFNKRTGDKLAFPRGRDVAMQFAIYEAGIFQANPTYLATITAEIRPFADRGGVALCVANTSVITQISSGEWDADTNQHFTITFPAAQTASLATANETDYWFVVTAITTGGQKLTLVSGPCLGINDGGDYSATVPTPGSINYVTTEQFYSALGAISAGGGVSNGYRWAIVVDPVTLEWTMNITAV
jgi:hypothetical protein